MEPESPHLPPARTRSGEQRTGWTRHLDAKRVVQAVAVLLVLGAAVHLGSAPLYTGETVTVTESGEEVRATTSATLAEVNGLGLALVVAVVPLLLTVIPLLVSGPLRQLVSIGCTVLLAAGVVVSGFSVGLFFVPALLAALVACLVPARSRPAAVG